ncbi:uncharacterized protein MONBRDRAFT_27614 [Monosiga brevicollis MX1]|uniref:Uncharacterized protein n=1 Tax=Monosiga brevicollis TaxID=81824 RepID=A9V5T2_MONBE|nr:uncharacterized protein MONBRDRAFT_27614 [Monosiga brevicollis MX1]EDQ87097.1 predicted protein [Monosiga brevicollis MX1]|eukprot:XP_001748040.1 hypothetical protein [Monosiga brevicollis MX1]
MAAASLSPGDGRRERLSSKPADNLKTIILALHGDSIKDIEKVHYLNFLCDKLAKQRKDPALANLLQSKSSALLKQLRLLMGTDNVQLRAATLRAVRHVVATDELALEAIRRGFDIFTCIALERSAQRMFEGERHQALATAPPLCVSAKSLIVPFSFPVASDFLKLARQLLRLTKPENIPRAIAATVAALAADYNDNLQLAAIEFLCELALRNPRLLAEVDGFQVLVAAALDCHNNAHNARNLAIVQTLVYTANRAPHNCVAAHNIFASLLSPYLDPHFVHISALAPASSESSLQTNVTEAQDRNNRLAASRFSVLHLLRSWAGIVYLTNAAHGLTSLVRVLHSPSMDSSTCSSLLAFFFHLLLLPLPTWSENFQKATEYRIPPYASDLLAEVKSGVRRRDRRIDLLNVYRAAVVAALRQAGLADTLLHVIVTMEDACIRVRANVLLADLLELTSRLLPNELALSLQALPFLMSLSSSPNACEKQKMRVDEASWNMDRYRRQMLTIYQQEPLPIDMAEATRHIDEVEDTFYLQRPNYMNKLKWELSEAAFMQALRDTKVMESKDMLSWSWPHILEVCDSAFLYPKGASEALPFPRFVRRILSYFHTDSPFRTHPFEEHQMSIYTRAGTILLSNLVKYQDGCDCIRQSDFFKTLLAALSDISPDKSVFSVQAVSSTLTRDYFRLIACMYSTQSGQALLQEHITTRLHKCLYKERRDLGELIIDSCNPQRSKAVRGLYKFALRNGSENLQIKVLAKLDVLAVPTRADDVIEFNKWIVELVVHTILESRPGKARTGAVNTLLSLCSTEDFCALALKQHEVMLKRSQSLTDPREIKDLQMLISRLELRLFGARECFRQFLAEHPKIVEQQLSRWASSRCLRYVHKVEEALNRDLYADPGKLFRVKTTLATDDGGRMGKVYVPTHLYGQLAAHDSGMEYLHEHGVVTHLCNEYFRLSRESLDNQADLHRLQSVIWSLCHIAGNKQDSRVSSKLIASMCQLATTTAIAICVTTYQMFLHTARLSNSNICVAIPLDVHTLFQAPQDPVAVSVERAAPLFDNVDPNAKDPYSEIKLQLQNVTNIINSRKSLDQMYELRELEPELFQDVGVFLHMRKRLALLPINLGLRRDLQSFFDMAAIVSSLPEFLVVEDAEHSSVPHSLFRIEAGQQTSSRPGSGLSEIADEAQQNTQEIFGTAEEQEMTDISEEEDWAEAIQLAFQEVAGYPLAKRETTVASFNPPILRKWEQYVVGKMMAAGPSAPPEANNQQPGRRRRSMSDPGEAPRFALSARTSAMSLEGTLASTRPERRSVSPVPSMSLSSASILRRRDIP